MVTLIPYSVYLLLLGSQLTAGILLSSLSGALFGAMRGSMALAPLSWKHYRVNPEAIRTFLWSLRDRVSGLNRVAIVIGGLGLVLSTLR